MPKPGRFFFGAVSPVLCVRSFRALFFCSARAAGVSPDLDPMKPRSFPFSPKMIWSLLTCITTVALSARVQDWTAHAHNHAESGVLYATGYSCEVLDYVWGKYADKLITALASLSKPLCFSDEYLSALLFLALLFIHHYPRWNTFYSHILKTDITGSVCKDKFYKCVVPVLCELSKLVDEVHWEDRFSPINHGTDYLADRFTSIFDGTNINVSNIYSDNELQRVMFCGSKYNHCCFKIMIGITFEGIIVHYTGLHVGAMNDQLIYDQNPPALLPWEWGMGDGAFESSWHILVKFQKPVGGVLNREMVQFNAEFNYWRLRVEHIIGVVKRHDALDGVWRGSYALLQCVVDLTVHLTNIKLKLSLPRYENVGPWGHTPGSAPDGP